MPRFQTIRKRDVPEALRGPWQSAPNVRLGWRGQLYFSHRAAEIFDGRRLVRVDLEPQSLVLRFAAVEAIPSGMVGGRLLPPHTPEQADERHEPGYKNRCSLISVSA
jgi:hypothetical protein